MKKRMPILCFLTAVLFLCASCAPNRFLELDKQLKVKINKTIHDVLIRELYEDDCELMTEAHVILNAEIKDKELYVYMIGGCSEYIFIDHVFRGTSYPASLFPAVAVFPNADDCSNANIDIAHKNVDGEINEDWLKEHFPPELISKARDFRDTKDVIIGQLKEQAKAYLKSIGRSEEMEADTTDEQIGDEIGIAETMPKQAYNTLLEARLFDIYPAWTGTIETLENNIRYVYETQIEKDSDGNTVIVFSKKLYDGSLIDQQKYQIIGEKAEKITASQ